jgi:hypothetical protein
MILSLDVVGMAIAYVPGGDSLAFGARQDACRQKFIDH